MAVALGLALLGVSWVAARASETRPGPRITAEDHQIDVAFSQFIQDHGRTYTPGTEEYAERRTLFAQHMVLAARYNSRPGHRWTAGINKLADRTQRELQALRGYKRVVSSRSDPAPQNVQFLGKEAEVVKPKDFPTEFSWVPHLKAMQEVQDQQACGSCWAFASTTVLRAHSEIYQEDRKFAVQEVVSCTPNPQKCGGNGGCDGATAELAMEYVMKRGCATEDEWPYEARSGDCPKFTEAAGFLAESRDDMSTWRGSGGASLGMMGYRQLPVNKYEPVMTALYQQGPVSVSIAAGMAWNLYISGIMDACAQDSVIDHAVALVGFGEDDGVKYWLLQNSWGQFWGENGFLRLERLTPEEEDKHCGWDNDPLIGSGCTGGPAKVWVCGSCGILNDVVVPEFRLGPKGLVSRVGKSGLHLAAGQAASLLAANVSRHRLRSHGRHHHHDQHHNLQ